MNAVLCTKCQRPQTIDHLAAGLPFRCDGCRSQMEVLVFPAIHQHIQPGVAAERAMVDGETTCFFHEEKKASEVCSSCGRLICSLCDIQIGGDHLCPKCVETGRTKKTLSTLENYRTSYPSMALSFALIPLLVWPLTLLTAPSTIFIVIYGWNKPASLTGRKRRFASVLALLIGIIECTAWVFVGMGIYRGITGG